MPHRAGTPTHCISQGHGVRIGHPLFKSRVPQWEREATPPAFAEWLVELARKCSKHNAPVRRGTPSPQVAGSASYWGPDGHCIHCGAGNDAHHSYTCQTRLHPDKRRVAHSPDCAIALNGRHECSCTPTTTAAALSDSE